MILHGYKNSGRFMIAPSAMSAELGIPIGMMGADIYRVLTLSQTLF